MNTQQRSQNRFLSIYKHNLNSKRFCLTLHANQLNNTLKFKNKKGDPSKYIYT